MKRSTFFVLGTIATLLGGCSGGGNPVLPTYPLDGMFQQVKVGDTACPGVANNSKNVAIQCGSDYRILFNATARTFRYYDAQVNTTIYQGTYYVLGSTLYMVVEDLPNRVVTQTLRYTEPSLTILRQDADSGQIDIAFNRIATL